MHLYNGRQLSNKMEGTAGTPSHMRGSEKQYAKWKSPTQKATWSSFTYDIWERQKEQTPGRCSQGPGVGGVF